jgi:HEPN domain-containing protein
MAPLSRITLQKLALAKVEDARLLFDNGRYSNAYYLYGYSVELGLKACIARQVIAETVPDKAILNGFLEHQISKLIALAGLSEQLKQRRTDPEFEIRWSVVAEWSVESRYDLVDVVTATAMKNAIEHDKHGVMKWLQLLW